MPLYTARSAVAGDGIRRRSKSGYRNSSEAAVRPDDVGHRCRFEAELAMRLQRNRYPSSAGRR